MESIPVPDGTAVGTSLDTIEITPHEPADGTYRAELLKPIWDRYVLAHRFYATIPNTGKVPLTERLGSCRTHAYFVIDTQTMIVRVASSACRLRFCPMCQRTRKFIVRKNAQAWLKTAKKPKFLTLTLQSSDDPLADQISSLYSAFVKLRRLKRMTRDCAGGIWFFQITFNSNTRQWHPHLHIAMDSEYIPHKWLSEQWEQITSDSKIVDIRAIHRQKQAAEYIARYAASSVNIESVPENAWTELASAMHKRRTCGTFGSAKAIRLTAPVLKEESNSRRILSYVELRVLAKYYKPAKIVLMAYHTGLPMTEIPNFNNIIVAMFTPDHKLLPYIDDEELNSYLGKSP